ncbi:MAG: hypothetical protein WBQ32_08805 [Ignavibacteriaceae bacterium]
MENDEKKYKDVIKALKGLQEVKAPANFEADLQRRINSEKFSKEEKKSFWQNIFVPAKLIPSFGLVAAAVVIFFVVETNSEEMDNPFLIEPRIREDVIEVTDYLDLQKKQEEIPKQKSSKKDEPVLEKRRDESELKSSEDKMITGREKSGEVEGLLDAKDVPEDQDINTGAYFAAESTVIVDSLAAPQPTTATVTSSELVTGQAITKEELNFRQVQLSKEEQKVVNELKTQVQSLDNVNKTQK